MLGFASSAQPTELLEQAQSELNLKEGEFAMFVLDMPNVPPQTPSIVMVAQTNQAQRSTTKAERTIGICQLVDNKKDIGADGVVNPNIAGVYVFPAANSYLQQYEHRRIDLTDEDVDSAKYTILQLPKHGTFKEDAVKPTLRGDYRYTPEVGYVGKDTAVVLVEIKGLKIKVVYYFHVLDSDIYGLWDLKCGEKGGEWKISSINNDPTSQLLTFNSSTQLTSYLAGAVNVVR